MHAGGRTEHHIHVAGRQSRSAPEGLWPPKFVHLGAIWGANLPRLIGKDSVSNKAYAGIGLSLLDGGMRHAELMGLALKTGLAYVP